MSEKERSPEETSDEPSNDESTSAAAAADTSAATRAATREYAWELVVSLQPQLRRCSDRAVRYVFGLAATVDRREECWSSVVGMLDRIADGWRPEKSTLEQRMVFCFYWYARNWCRDTLRELRRERAYGVSAAYADSSDPNDAVSRAESTDGSSRAVSGDTAEQREAIARATESMSEYQVWLTRAHYLEDRTLRDIGEQVGVSRTTIAKDIAVIEQLLRESLRGYR